MSGLLRLVSRKAKQAEGGEDEPKKYKKANLGQSNQMYYSTELKMWVERGKEDEARAEKAKLSAPPPSVGSLSAASSSTSLAAMSDAASAAGGPPPALNFSRSKGLSGRYVNVSTIATAPAAGTPGVSPAPAGPKALLPGMGGPKLPGIPAALGSGPPSFFKPTPAASEASDAAVCGSEIGSVSGLSGLDPSFPNSRNASQPNFFVPPAPSTSSPTTTEDTQGAGGAADSLQGDGARTSSGSGAAAQQRPSSDGVGGFAMRESDTSGSGRLPAASGPSNVSFASWQHLRESGTGSPAAVGAGAGPHVPHAAAGDDLLLGQQASSSADMEADAQAEVSLPAVQPYHVKEQPQQFWTGPDSNGHAGTCNSNGFYVPGAVGAAGVAEPLANGDHSTRVNEQQQQLEQQQGEEQPLPAQVSASWDARPVVDPLDGGAGVPVAETGTADWGAVEGGANGWEGPAEGGEWGQTQPQQPYDYTYGQQQLDPYIQQQQQQAPLAVGMSAEAGAAWGVQGVQEATAGWDGQQHGWQGGWGSGADADAGAADPEGGAAAASGDPSAADPDAWQQPQGDGFWQPQQQQQPPQAAEGQQGYYSGYGEQYQAAAGWGGQQADLGAPACSNGPYQQQQQQQQAQDGAAAAAYGGYFQAAVAASAEQPAVELLDPIHPQLPGIAVAGQGRGGVTSPTYALPGTPGSSGSRKGAMRHTSMPGSPLSHQTSMGALLPQPPRRSAGGLSTQRSLGLDGQPEAAAVVLSTAAAAGDASLLTAVRPKSPFARNTSPLSRTSTGMGDAAIGKQSSGGFPIPSPPSHGGFLSGRVPNGNIFIPGNVNVAAAPAAAAPVPMPWQPGAAAAQGAEYMQSQQQQEHGLANGYDAAAQSYWQQQQHGYGAGQQQQDQAAAVSSGGAAVPPFMPGLLESLPRDAPPSSHSKRDGMQQPFMPLAAAAGAAVRQDDRQAGAERAHPYDQFLSQALSQVNWRAVHFKQPGKLNKMLPWEEFEMEKALREEADKQASGQGRQSPFWYRQMEFRQKLPAGSMKPSASEPAHMPSHAVNKAPPPSAADSAASQVSAYPGWPNSGELQQHHQQQAQQQQYQVPQQQLLVPGSPLTPARAATTGALGAVAAGDTHAHLEEPTPTSKLAPSAEVAQAAAAVEAAAAGDGAQVAAGDGQQQWAGYQGYGYQAANGFHQQDQYGQQWQPEQQQQQYDMSGWQQQDGQYVQQQYDPSQAQYGQYGEYAQQYQPDQQQQYNMSSWQQQPQPQQQQQEGVAVDQTAVAPEDWAPQAGAARGATWGSPDAEMLESGAPQAQGALEQPQQGDYSAAAADEVAGAWGAEDAALDLQLDLQLRVVSVAADPAAALAEAAALAYQPAAGAELHAPEVIAAARVARISTSSIGLESQPSTGRAACRRIVSTALEKAQQQDTAVPEDADQEAAAAAGCGWEGGEADADGWEGGAQVDEQEQEGGDEYADEGCEPAAAPVSTGWARLAQQFSVAVDAGVAMGLPAAEFHQYREHFKGYGDYMVSAIPREALEQAGLLADDSAAAAVGAEVSQASAAEVDEEQEEFMAEFGRMQLKEELAAGMFASLGFDLESLMECCADA